VIGILEGVILHILTLPENTYSELTRLVRKSLFPKELQITKQNFITLFVIMYLSCNISNRFQTYSQISEKTSIIQTNYISFSMMIGI